MITRAIIETASNQFLEIENGAEVSVVTRVESQIADGLIAGVNSFSSEYGVEVLAHSKKDCYGRNYNRTPKILIFSGTVL
jgi:hypothetical protein